MNNVGFGQAVYTPNRPNMPGSASRILCERMGESVAGLRECRDVVNMTAHPSNVVLNALSDYISPSDEILGNHRKGMDGRFRVLGETAELMGVELAELNRI